MTARYLVGEVPGGLGTADGLAGELVEDGRRQVDGVAIAAHALVDDGGGGGLAGALALDGDGAAAVGVAVGLLAHEGVREGDDVLRVGRRNAARAQAGVVVGDVAGAGAALGALAAAAAAAGAGRSGGDGCRSSRRRRGRLRSWGRRGRLSRRRRGRRSRRLDRCRWCRSSAGLDDGRGSDGRGDGGRALEELRRALGRRRGLRVRVRGRGLAAGRRGELSIARDPVGGGGVYNLGDIVDVGDPDDVVLTLLVVVRGVLVLVSDGSRDQEGGSEDCGLHDADDEGSFLFLMAWNLKCEYAYVLVE